QAEDGIRAKLVTGVQTCALPIYGLVEQARHLAKSPVSAGEPEALIDALEAVQVEDDEAHGAPVGLGAIDLALQHFVQGDAVRHRSEERRVGKGGSARWCVDP